MPSIATEAAQQLATKNETEPAQQPATKNETEPAQQPAGGGALFDSVAYALTLRNPEAAQQPATGQKRKKREIDRDVVAALMDLFDSASNWDEEGEYNHHGGEEGEYFTEAKKALGCITHLWTDHSIRGFSKICARFPEEIAFLREHKAMTYKTPESDYGV